MKKLVDNTRFRLKKAGKENTMTQRRSYLLAFVITLICVAALSILIVNPIHSQDVKPYSKDVNGKVGNKEATTDVGAIRKKQLDPLAVSLSQPKTREKILCSRGADGIYRVSVTGNSSGLSAAESVLLLWAEPVSPAAEGWFLQRPPINGIHDIGTNGSWTGVVQIGNLQWPPHEGDLFNFAASVVDQKTAKKLLDEPGVVVRSQPVGVKVDTALSVVVALK